MRKVTILTLLTSFITCLTVIVVVSTKHGFPMGFFVGIMTFGNMLVPTLASVMFYFYIRHKIITHSRFLTVLTHIAALTLFFMFGIVFWGFGEALFGGDITISKLEIIYYRDFHGFIPLVYLEAALIPILGMSWKITLKKVT